LNYGLFHFAAFGVWFDYVLLLSVWLMALAAPMLMPEDCSRHQLVIARRFWQA
jgi:hypothetical protein